MKLAPLPKKYQKIETIEVTEVKPKTKTSSVPNFILPAILVAVGIVLIK